MEGTLQLALELLELAFELGEFLLLHRDLVVKIREFAEHPGVSGRAAAGSRGAQDPHVSQPVADRQR